MTKTTINLPTPLLRKTKIFAAQNNLTMSEILIRSLETTLSNSVNYEYQKPSLAQFLRDNPSPFKPLTDKEAEHSYRQAMEEKHG